MSREERDRNIATIGDAYIGALIFDEQERQRKKERERERQGNRLCARHGVAMEGGT